jgi:hypothetical protein
MEKKSGSASRIRNTDCGQQKLGRGERTRMDAGGGGSGSRLGLEGGRRDREGVLGSMTIIVS